MFESYSSRYESGFRIFFIVWVCIWTLANASELIVNYASFTYSNDVDPFQWLFRIFGVVASLSIGIVLLFYMSSVSSIVKKQKPISSLAMWIALAVVYYFFKTGFDFLGILIFDNGEDIGRRLVFLVGWFMPSAIILGLHIAYFMNLFKYNEELEEKVKDQTKA
jgi:Na+/melibiose symporter-like transporter